MYALIESGNKQYKVEKGTVIDVELLGVEKDSSVTLDNVLLISSDEDIKIGTPTVKGAKVTAKVLDGELKDAKVTAFKYKNKTGYHRTLGHRQRYTRLQIEEISA